MGLRANRTPDLCVGEWYCDQNDIEYWRVSDEVESRIAENSSHFH